MNSPAISVTAIDRLGWVLVHSLWQFVLVAIVALLLKAFLRRASSETRYEALVTAFTMIVLTPVVAATVYRPPASPMLPAKTAAATESPVVASATRVAEIDGFELSLIEPSHADSTHYDGRPGRAVSWSAVEQYVRRWLNAIVAIWCCGVPAFTLRPVLGWYNLRRLCHVGASPVPDTIREVLDRTAERLHVCRAIGILQSTLVQVPLVVGYLRPTILLPVSIVTNLPVLQLEAILAHELAHIRRHDYLVNLWQTLVETVFFYHPAVWWLSREIRRERENCCDDLAIAWLGNRLEYGRALLSVEEMRATAPALALGASGGSLVARVRRLLVVEPVRRSLSYSWSAGTAASCLALAIGLAASMSVLAQTKPEPAKLGYLVDGDGDVITTQKKAATDPKADGPDGPEKAATPPAAAKPLLARSEQVQRALGKPTTVNFRECPLNEVIKLLAGFHQIDIRIDKESLQAGEISLDESPVTLKLHQVSLRSVLQLMLEPMQLGYFVDEGGLVITSQEKAAEHSATDGKSRSLDIAIAEHVLMWDGEIVTWEEVVERLRKIRKQRGAPVHPNFKFTNGAIKAGLWDRYQKAAFGVYEELFDPVGMSIGSMSPRAGERFDAIRTKHDLVPKPEHVRTGVVRNAGGRPVTVAIVVLMPEDSAMPVMLQPNLSLRDSLDEVWVRTDKQGRFKIACPDTGHKLVVLSPAGFALAPVPKPGEPAEIQLLPNSELELTSADKSLHELGISVHLPGMPDGHSGFSIYEIKIGEQSKTLRLPPGKVTVSRVVEVDKGRTRYTSLESFELKPGEKKTLSIVPPDPEDQE